MKEGEAEFKRKDMPLPSAEEGTVICVVQRLVGAGFVEALCTDGEVYMARIPGKMRRKVWIKVGDVVLLLPWGTKDKKGDIEYKYEKEEVKRLIEAGLLSEDLLESVGA
ncbi:MAG: translation initiation factor aIF-1A [Acidilobaceae archaeon]|nr:translation initiation factor aIF-1A [Acidilobaceae archaeon]